VVLTWGELAAFMGLCLVLAATPGANLAVVLRCAALGGQRAAVGASVGLTMGKAFWAAASLVGLAALLAASATAYNAVKLLGAAYLVWLGLQALWSTRRATTGKLVVGPPLTALGGFRRGLLGDMLNPKVGLFYTTVFPQFIEPADPLVPAALALLAAHAVVLLTWYPGVSWLLARAGQALRRPALTRALSRITGGVLIGLGVRLALTPSS
jgi:threonine/homoserine/homoserine lactone efflux protein